MTYEAQRELRTLYIADGCNRQRTHTLYFIYSSAKLSCIIIRIQLEKLRKRIKWRMKCHFCQTGHAGDVVQQRLEEGWYPLSLCYSHNFYYTLRIHSVRYKSMTEVS